MISIPINAIVLLAGGILSFIISQKIPSDTYAEFVFWVMKPCSHITFTLTGIILVVGFAGNIRYTKCWQGSYSFFVFLLTLFYYLNHYFAANLPAAASNVIPQVYQSGAFLQEIEQIYSDLNCSTWDLFNGTCTDLQYYKIVDCEGHEDERYIIEGCYTKIISKMGTVSTQISSLSKIGILIMLIYTLFLLFVFIFVEEESQVELEHKPVD